MSHEAKIKPKSKLPFPTGQLSRCTKIRDVELLLNMVGVDQIWILLSVCLFLSSLLLLQITPLCTGEFRFCRASTWGRLLLFRFLFRLFLRLLLFLGIVIITIVLPGTSIIASAKRRDCGNRFNLPPIVDCAFAYGSPICVEGHVLAKN